MEDRITAYEKFIAKASRRPSVHLAHYHREMLANFQHERLIHLIITLFFATLALISVVLAFLATAFFLEISILIPLYLLTLILVVLSFFYVKHYYFLENHIQALYEYSKKLALKG